MILIFDKKTTEHFLIRICIVTDDFVMTKLAESWENDILNNFTASN